MRMNPHALWWVIGILLLLLLIIGWYFFSTSDSGAGDEAAVREAVVHFGAALKEVPLLASSTAITIAMDEAYGEYVVPDLIAAWQSTPERAPGRLTSSPWPDRISVASVNEQSDGSYMVKGNVVETTSAGDGSSYPVTLSVERRGSEWLIADFVGYPPHP